VPARPRKSRQHPTSHTGKALREYLQAVPGGSGKPVIYFARKSPALPNRRRAECYPGFPTTGTNSITIHNAREHNLQNIDVENSRRKRSR
jgi:excinuclease ABC subunit A